MSQRLSAKGLAFALHRLRDSADSLETAQAIDNLDDHIASLTRQVEALQAQVAAADAQVEATDALEPEDLELLAEIIHDGRQGSGYIPEDEWERMTKLYERFANAYRAARAASDETPVRSYEQGYQDGTNNLLADINMMFDVDSDDEVLRRLKAMSS